MPAANRRPSGWLDCHHVRCRCSAATVSGSKAPDSWGGDAVVAIRKPHWALQPLVGQIANHLSSGTRRLEWDAVRLHVRILFVACAPVAQAQVISTMDVDTKLSNYPIQLHGTHLA